MGGVVEGFQYFGLYDWGGFEELVVYCLYVFSEGFFDDLSLSFRFCLKI